MAFKSFSKQKITNSKHKNNFENFNKDLNYIAYYLQIKENIGHHNNSNKKIKN